MTLCGSTVAAAYRADGLRASKSSGSGTTYFLYDGGEPIVELNSSGSVTALNVFAPDGLVARAAGETTTEYVFDQQGNVADRTDTSGTIQSITQYDGWGNEQTITGHATDPFGYNAQSGYYLDRETGLYLCQHRFYDPANGRWLNRDPIGYGGGTNLYGYCAGRPVNFEDPSGAAVISVQVALVGMVVFFGGTVDVDLLVDPNGSWNPMDWTWGVGQHHAMGVGIGLGGSVGIGGGYSSGHLGPAGTTADDSAPWSLNAFADCLFGASGQVNGGPGSDWSFGGGFGRLGIGAGAGVFAAWDNNKGNGQHTGTGGLVGGTYSLGKLRDLLRGKLIFWPQ